MSTVKIYLKKGKEKKIKHFYPWVFRDEILKVEGEGIIATLLDYKGNFLAKGTYSSHSRIAFRVLTYREEDINTNFFIERLKKSLLLREGIASNAFRAVFSESDLLSGLIVDKYDQGLVIQVRSYPMEVLKEIYLPALVEVFKPRFIYERSDFKGRLAEGLKEFKGLLYGELKNPVLIEENGIKFLVDVEKGLKTGFYLDQRDNRLYIAESVERGQKVLDLFTHTGGFAVYAAKKGAKVWAVDINADVLEIARENAKLNGVEVEFIAANAFEFLENTDQSYDLIIADPPAIAKTKKEKESILWAVWKLAYKAFKKLNPLGRLFICTCTYQISAEELTRQVRLAASDAGKRIFVRSLRGQPKDHPYVPFFPESWYLKCLDVQLYPF
ncbi:MAG: class I SAM-dependent rRNA methyltransferase [Aquificae bacterium]|nr:class I SAM-dependent rRNA methyltransferase [Aquificota bacterium]